MPTKIFDVEEQIMSAWQTSTDLQLMIEHFYDNKETIDKDEFWNMATGIYSLHEARMNKLFAVYERFTSEYYKERKTFS